MTHPLAWYYLDMSNTRVVVIGGGHGQSVILSGLKKIKNIQLSTIVTMADDGGSTGRLRKYMQVPAVGDLRNVMIALSEDETILRDLMDYRFEGEEEIDVGGHNLGNLILTAMVKQTGSLIDSISALSRVLRVKGEVIPSTTQFVTLCARMDDGTIVRGESNIPKFFNDIEEVYYQEKVKANKNALKAIREADLIILGIGSLYTSIAANLAIPSISKAIRNSKARKVYLCNAMTQHGETDGYCLEDHVRAIEKHLEGKIDLVVFPNDILPEDLLEKYSRQDSYPVSINEKNHDYQIMKTSMLSFDSGLIRHDSDKIANVIKSIIRKL